MSAPRAAAQRLQNASVARLFVPPATTRAGTAQRAIPTIAPSTRLIGWGEVLAGQVTEEGRGAVTWSRSRLDRF